MMSHWFNNLIIVLCDMVGLTFIVYGIYGLYNTKKDLEKLAEMKRQRQFYARHIIDYMESRGHKIDPDLRKMGYPDS